MRIELPYPPDALWPNKRPHWATKHRATKKAKRWAYNIAKAEGRFPAHDGLIPVKITVCPKPRGRAPDRDNVVAAFKAYQDGISSAIGIDDRFFSEPVIEISKRRTSTFIIEIGGAE